MKISCYIFKTVYTRNIVVCWGGGRGHSFCMTNTSFPWKTRNTIINIIKNCYYMFSNEHLDKISFTCN